MHKYIRALSIVSLLAYPCLPWATGLAPNPNDSQTSAEAKTNIETIPLCPMWIVRDYKLTPHSRWTAENAQQWLFKSLEVTAEAIRFIGQECLQPQLTAEPLSREDFKAWTGGLSAEDFKITEGTLERVMTGCKIEGMDQYLRSADGRLLIRSHGVVFVLGPNVNF
jgi:hypothetical protein